MIPITFNELEQEFFFFDVGVARHGCKSDFEEAFSRLPPHPVCVVSRYSAHTLSFSRAQSRLLSLFSVFFFFSSRCKSPRRKPRIESVFWFYRYNVMLFAISGISHV